VFVAPAPAGGFATIGKPTSPTNARASPALPTRRWRAHGSPAARSTSFIRDLSRKFRAAATDRPGSPRCSRATASGSCSCSSEPTSRSTGATCRCSSRTPATICAGSSASATCQCARTRRASSGGSFCCGSWLRIDSVIPGSDAAPATNRSVASITNGIT
jgi:hypothetical protein